MIRYIFFDVANTLLHKPGLHESIGSCLNRFGYQVPLSAIKLRHKLLSEALRFPDKTDEQFYFGFNSELLYSLGIIPNEELLTDIYSTCGVLKWKPFADTDIISTFTQPTGIISNWDDQLVHVLKQHFSQPFFRVTCSSQLGIAKPELQIYREAIVNLDVDPSEVAYVGDSIKLDIQPANMLGMRAILIDRDGLFPSYVGRRISSLNQLTTEFA